jgi:hypothetical protein
MHTLFISPLQMSTIWADTVDQARSAARDFVFAGLSDRGDLYGLFDCWYDYDRVKVKMTPLDLIISVVQGLYYKG